MTQHRYLDQLSALRNVVFTAVDEWNAAHPQPLSSRREHGSVNVTEVYTDGTGTPSFTITVDCALSGSAHLTFHGHDLAAVVEQARLTLEHRISAELARRAARAQDNDLDHRFGVAV